MVNEQKAKAYDEALERARKQRDDYQKELDKTDKNSQLANILRGGISAVEMIFPQLKENDDERIRQAIIKSIEEDSSIYEQEVSKEQMLTYLEKQKEPHYSPLCNTIKDKIREYIANHFIADTVVKTDMRSIVKAMEEGVRLGEEKQKEQKSSIVEKLRKISTPADEDWFEIQKQWEKEDEQKLDTRDADDLQLLGFIYDLLNEIEWKDNWAMSKDECLRRLNNYRPQKPASISYGHENDAEWGQEDKHAIENCEYAIKETFKDEQNPHRIGTLNWLKSLPERFVLQLNQEWSEEDKKRVKQLIYDTEHIRAEYEKRKKELGESFNDELIKDCDEQIAWLKDIFLNHKKFNEAIKKLWSNEWSEDDEKDIAHIIKILDDCYAFGRHDLSKTNHENLVNKLKSLHPIKQKWNEEDEKTINDACCFLGEYAGYIGSKNWGKSSMLFSIVDKLKSLYPYWKPSEEQMDRLFSIVAALRKDYCDDMADFLANLYADLEKLGVKKDEKI